MKAYLKRSPLYRLFLLARTRVRSDGWLRTQLTKRGHSLDKAILEKRPSSVFAAELEDVLKEMSCRGMAPGEPGKWVWNLIYQARFGEEATSAGPGGAPAPPATGGEVQTAIRTRRSVRLWTDAPVEPGILARAMDAARWAPSSCNRQPCLFIALTAKEDKEFLTRFTPQPFFLQAPLMLAVLVNARVYAPAEEHLAFLDSGAAIQNLLLALHAEGLGACWISIKYNDTFDENSEAFRIRFGHDTGYKLVSFIAAGHPAKLPAAPPRKPLETFYRVSGEE